MSKATFLADRNEDPVPSYEESISSTSVHTGESGTCMSVPPLHRHLDEERLRRVQSILTTHIAPLLLIQGASGLYKTIFLLIPSNVYSLQINQTREDSYSAPKEPEILGFSSTDFVKLVRLSGEEHTIEFWRQPAVLEELGLCLKARLVAGGHRIEQDEPSPTRLPIETEVVNHQSPQSKESSFWRRGKTRTPSEPYQVEDLKLGWRTEHENLQTNKPPRDEVRVTVQMKEICLRAENQMGLYETYKGQGIVLSIEVGH
jgi:hypothetical protein